MSSQEAAALKRSPKQAVVKARRELHRQLLIEAAERVFAQRGYEGTRMQDLAAGSGLALATVYGVCGSKEELYAEVHRVRGRALLERAVAATVGARSAFDAICAGVRGYTEYLLQHPDYLKLHLLESQPWALQPRFTSAEQGRLWREGLEMSVEMFRAAIAEGSVVDENAALLARLMIAAHQVFLGEWVEEGMKEPPESLVARMQAHLDRTFARRRRKS
jgi:AcrR family transcriptional regulator